MKTVAPKRKLPSFPGEGQFDSYEERFVSLERHQRVVHYYLKRHGRETLAVVGTEKSPRHLNYVVQAAFLDAVGLTSTGELIKWRTRREVLEWLDTFVKEPRKTDGQLSGLDDRTGKFKKQKKSSSSVVGKVPRRPADVWRGDDGQTHFKSVQHDGVAIYAHDFVEVLGEDPSANFARVAYVEDLVQAEGEEVLLEVRWLEPADSSNEKELLLTESTDHVRLDDVDGPAAVLSQAHWDRFTPPLLDTELQHLYCCLEPEAGPSIQGLKGYWAQHHAGHILGEGVLSSLKPPRKRPPQLEPSSPPQLSSASRGGSDLSWGGVPKKKRFSGSYAEDDFESSPRIRKKRRRMPGDPPRRLGRPPKLLTSARGGQSPKPIHGGTKRVQGSPVARGLGGFGGFAVGDAVETLCEDSGLRGCWFRGQVIAVAAPRRLKIRYEELDDEEGSSKLEEWVTVSRSSAKDSLDQRAFGRSRVRPRPPSQPQPGDFSIGEAVDAWWNDGWWEGVVASEQDKKVGVFFPGEGDSAWFHPGELRLSKEWVEGAWKRVPGLENVAGLMTKGERVGTNGEGVAGVVRSVKAELPETRSERTERDGSEKERLSELDGKEEQHSPNTPAACEPHKSPANSAVLALSSFPRERPSQPRGASPPAAHGVRKLGPSILGRSSTALAPPPSETSAGEGGNREKPETGKAERTDTDGFECLENIEDEEEMGSERTSWRKWGPAKQRGGEPAFRSRLVAPLEGRDQGRVHTPRFDTVPTPEGKERTVWTHVDASPSPSPSSQGPLLAPAGTWEAPSNALESERKEVLVPLEAGAQQVSEVSASKLAEMDPNSEVNKAACELPRPALIVKRADLSSRGSAGQQSCSVDAGPPQSGNPQPILSR